MSRHDPENEPSRGELICGAIIIVSVTALWALALFGGGVVVYGLYLGGA